jgi:plastocyanin
MGTHRTQFRPFHRAILWGSAAMVVAGTGALSVAAATPTVKHLYQQVDTHGSFLPTSGPQRTVIIGPDGNVYDPPADDAVPPHPDPAFLQQVPGGPCTAENPYEGGYVTPKRYGDGCKRIHFAFGPINVRPGMNDAMLRPTAIEQPRYDGYVVRFLPGLVRATDGSVPPVEQLHLHHATWLNLNNSYGDGPFFAAGEEKTIADFPTGYGMHVGANDLWGLLYMVHAADATPDNVWLTYDIDFVDEASADKAGIVNAKPLWLDVQRQSIYKGAPSTGANPVFNVQRGFGHKDPMTGTRVCGWPDEECGNFDVYGHKTPQQGKNEQKLGADIAGADYTVPKDMAGTLIGLGGHLHPGGIRDEVSLVRDGVEKPIFYSDSVNWNHQNPKRAGGPPTSWDFSMTVTGSPLDWKVKVKPGDTIRLNAVYDTQLSSWYENMGIVVGYVAVKDPHGPPGIDVFDDNVKIVNGAPAQARLPKGPFVFNYRPKTCHPSLTGKHKVLCLHGQPTHGALRENLNTSSPCTKQSCPQLTHKMGPMVSDIYSAGFTYGAADFGVVDATGIPRVKRGSPLTFWNLDSSSKVYHTFTACRYPCSGPTAVDYPLADGGNGKPSDPMNFESMEVGYGMLFEPSKSQVGGSEPYDEQWMRNGIEWTFTPTRDGTYTFFCRVHPGMRGVFKVVG